MNKWRTKNGFEIVQILSGRSNVFLLSNGKMNILVDTSVARLRVKLQNRLDLLGIKTVDYLILTHAHFDHAANAALIKKKYKAKVILQRKEARYLGEGENILPKGTNFFTRLIINFLGKYLIKIFRYKSCKPDILVDSHYDLKEFGNDVYLIHTPGHTPGSMSLVVDDEISLVGDTMFGVFKWSVFPPFAEDQEVLIKSWGLLLGTNCKEFVPSHGTPNKRFLVQREYDQRTRKSLD